MSIFKVISLLKLLYPQKFASKNMNKVMNSEFEVDDDIDQLEISKEFDKVYKEFNEIK